MTCTAVGGLVVGGAAPDRRHCLEMAVYVRANLHHRVRRLVEESRFVVYGSVRMGGVVDVASHVDQAVPVPGGEASAYRMALLARLFRCNRRWIMSAMVPLEPPAADIAVAAIGRRHSMTIVA